MVSEKIYERCRPVLEDEALGEEEKTDRLEELLRAAPSSLHGKALEDAVLGALWQWKSASDTTASPPPVRGINVTRTRSPAPWVQRAGTPGGSPRPSSTAPIFARTKSTSGLSPFSSPRPSPRLPVAAPSIPHGSPRLSAYQPSSSPPLPSENYGDYGSDTVDWLLHDDDLESEASSFADSGFVSSGTMEYMSPSTIEMTPYDMLRSILQNNSSDEELEQILEANGYDLGQAVNSIMEAAAGASIVSNAMATAMPPDQPPRNTYLVGKSMSPSSRPLTPQKSPIVCRYWLASGHCARADCRFAHEVQSTHVCKYWMQGACIAGNSCLFSHDPANLMQQLAIANSGASTPQQYPPNFQFQDYDTFPALQPTTSNPYDESTGSAMDPAVISTALQQQQQQQQQSHPAPFPTFVPTGPKHASRPASRPTSRHASRAPTPSQPAQPNFQDDEAFPTLGSAAATKSGKRHHGKRGGHGHGGNNSSHSASPAPSSLAEVVRASPSPQPNTKEAMRRGLLQNRSFTSSREHSAQAMQIPAPTEIPWMETGEKANQAYLKARQEAFKHGGLRNKFLQSAAQAWNRNDARGAKALSLRGQNENGLMREKHREAARLLYEERNQHSTSGKELYVDLHGLHPEEAVSYLSACLQEQPQIPSSASFRPLYAICGTGHHSKNGKDKVGKAVRQYLNDWKYAFREFSVPGDRNNAGGILGIDPRSQDKSLVRDADSGVGFDDAGATGKVVVVKHDPRVEKEEDVG